MAEQSGTMPQPGDRAPAFTLPAMPDGTVRLTGLKGRRVVLYFYPKDNTQGCTVEATDFERLLPEFEQLDVAVLGISPDSFQSHEKFAAKQGLSFPLLSDADHKVAEKYGVWQEKQLYGRKFWGIVRTTFAIGPNGKIERVWPKVRVKDHADAVLEWCREQG